MFTFISRRQSDLAISRGFYFPETSKFRENSTLTNISEFTVSVKSSTWANLGNRASPSRHFLWMLNSFLGAARCETRLSSKYPFGTGKNAWFPCPPYN